jgi:hypothetical protein
LPASFWSQPCLNSPSTCIAAYREAAAIAERLSKADAGNAGWQRDLAASLQRVGLIAAQQGNHETAPNAYRHGVEIMQRLIALAPDHVAFRGDLAWFEENMAALEKP